MSTVLKKSEEENQKQIEKRGIDENWEIIKRLDKKCRQNNWRQAVQVPQPNDRK